MDRSGAGGGGRGGGGRRRKAINIKSNNPHLAGGEQYSQKNKI